jgi:streptogramin lyase
LTLAGGLLLAAPSGALAPPGEIEQFPFSSPEAYSRGGLAAGSDGNVWFTESSAGGKGVIGLITPEGKFVEYTVPTASPATPELPAQSYPNSIAQGPGGEMWFTDSGTNSEKEDLIGRVIMKTGEIKEFPVPPEVYPVNIAAGPEGDMWFTADSSIGGKLGRISPTGVVTLYVLPTEPSSNVLPGYSEPLGIAQGPGGYVWFTEGGTNREGKQFVGRINVSTEKIEDFLIPTENSFPTGIAQGPNGSSSMWFVETNADKIGEIAPTGEIKEEFPVPRPTYSPIGIAAGPDGDMWFSENSEVSSIGRITASGEVKTFPIPTKEPSEHSYPEGIVRGPDGNMWFIESGVTEVSPIHGKFHHIGRLTTPFLSVSTSPPTITGTPTQGQALTASPGSWSNGPTFAYQWQECDVSGNNCAPLPGEIGVTHFLAAGDVGHTLRVVVTATDIAGSASATSAPSAVVSATAPPPPPPPPPKVTPSVEASMTWTFGWTRKYTLVESLIAHGVPRDGKVEVVCHGHGCPFSHHASATVAGHHSSHHACHGRKCKQPKPRPQGPEVSLTSLFKGHHLGVGATISVRIVRSGWIGKVFVFTTRSGQTPHVQISCLAPGSTTPGKGC